MIDHKLPQAMLEDVKNVGNADGLKSFFAKMFDGPVVRAETAAEAEAMDRDGSNASEAVADVAPVRPDDGLWSYTFLISETYFNFDDLKAAGTLPFGALTVFMRASDIESRPTGEILYTGSEAVVSSFRTWLAEQSAATGSPNSEVAPVSPHDLYCALSESAYYFDLETADPSDFSRRQ